MVSPCLNHLSEAWQIKLEHPPLGRALCNFPPLVYYSNTKDGKYQESFYWWVTDVLVMRFYSHK